MPYDQFVETYKSVGRVSYTNAGKGFGYIAPFGGDKDVYFNRRGVGDYPGEFANEFPKVGDWVAFTIYPAYSGFAARCLELISREQAYQVMIDTYHLVGSNKSKVFSRFHEPYPAFKSNGQVFVNDTAVNFTDDYGSEGRPETINDWLLENDPGDPLSDSNPALEERAE